MATLTLSGARVVTPDGVLDSGWVSIARGEVVGVGPGRRAGDDLTGHTLVPGFVDLHCHGGGGHGFDGVDVERAQAAVDWHRARGTTTTLASLITAPLDRMCRAAETLAVLARRGEIAGIHLEGPFISPVRCGAQDVTAMLDPDPVALDRLLDAGDGFVRQVTLAPERAGGLDLVSQVVAAGAIAAVGHSDASYDLAIEAFARGATLVTHLGNGMRPFHHRDPGLFAAAVTTEGVTCEVIGDGIHLGIGTLRLVAAGAGPDRVALITDAVPAAGLPDGVHAVGHLRIRVADGAVTLDGTDHLAGSLLSMDAGFARLSWAAGLGLATASAMASGTPCAVLGLADRGTLAVGQRADLVVLGDDLLVRRVMRAGEWVT